MSFENMTIAIEIQQSLLNYNPLTTLKVRVSKVEH